MELDLQRKNLQTLDFSEMLAGPTPRNADDGGSNISLDQDEVCAAREALHMGVTKIDAQHNVICFIGSLHYFRALRSVDLSHNNMSIVRGDIWPRTLQKLDVSFNKLRHLSFVLQMQCPNLQWLNVAGNENLTSLGWGIYCEQRAREFYSSSSSCCSSSEMKQQLVNFMIPEDLQNEIGPLGDDNKIPVSLRNLQVLQVSECENLDSLDGLCLCRNLVELYADRCDLSSASSFFGLSSNRLVRLLGEEADAEKNLSGFSTSPASIGHRWQIRKGCDTSASSATQSDDDDENKSNHDESSKNNNRKLFLFPKLEVVDISENPLSCQEIDLIKSTLEQKWMKAIGDNGDEVRSGRNVIQVAPCLEVKSHFLDAGCEEMYQKIRKMIHEHDEANGDFVQDVDDADDDMVAYVQQRMKERDSQCDQNNNKSIMSISSAGGGDNIEGTGRNEQDPRTNGSNPDDDSVEETEILVNRDNNNNTNAVLLAPPSDASTIHSEISLSEESMTMQLNNDQHQDHRQQHKVEKNSSESLLKELDQIRAMLVYGNNNTENNHLIVDSEPQRDSENEVDDEEDEEEEISHGAWVAPPAAKAVICSSSSDVSENDDYYIEEESNFGHVQKKNLQHQMLDLESTVSSVTTIADEEQDDVDDDGASISRSKMQYVSEIDEKNINSSLLLSVHSGPAGTPPLILSAKKKQEMARQRQQEQNRREEQERLSQIQRQREQTHQEKNGTNEEELKRTQKEKSSSAAKTATSRNLFSPIAANESNNEKNSSSSPTPQQQQLREQVMHFRARRMALEEEKKQLLRDLAKSRKDSAETARCIVDLKRMKNSVTEVTLTLSKQLDKTKREVQYAVTAKKCREEKLVDNNHSSDSFINNTTTLDSSVIVHNQAYHQDPSTIIVPSNSTIDIISPSPISANCIQGKSNSCNNNKNNNVKSNLALDSTKFVSQSNSRNSQLQHHFSPAESAAIHQVQEAAAKNLHNAAQESDKLFEKREKDRRRNLRPDKILGNLNTKTPGASPIFQSREGREKYEQVLAPSPLREIIRRERMQQQQQQQIKRPSSSTSTSSLSSLVEPKTAANSISRQPSVNNNNNNTFSFVFTGKPATVTTAVALPARNASNVNSRVLSLRMPNRASGNNFGVTQESEIKSKPVSTHHDVEAGDQEQCMATSSPSTVFVFEP